MDETIKLKARGLIREELKEGAVRSCQEETMTSKEELIDYMGTKPSNPDQGRLCDLLIRCASAGYINGFRQEAMEPRKINRAKSIEIVDEKTIRFSIERHGGTALGSKYATIQEWTINVAEGTAECSEVGRRRIEPLEPSITKVQLAELAQNLFDRVEGNDHKDPRIRWLEDGRITIRIGRCIPSEGVAKLTVEGRRRRFKESLRAEAQLRGWKTLPRQDWFSNWPTFLME
jgi:hypothetical protein